MGSDGGPGGGCGRRRGAAGGLPGGLLPAGQPGGGGPIPTRRSGAGGNPGGASGVRGLAGCGGGGGRVLPPPRPADAPPPSCAGGGSTRAHGGGTGRPAPQPQSWAPGAGVIPGRRADQRGTSSSACRRPPAAPGREPPSRRPGAVLGHVRGRSRRSALLPLLAHRPAPPRADDP
ncbi:MAG: hypothetical protein FJW79_09545 [Actinobacteria bacterium]|nr:hypothetical protein [Actinomycetota bacterium]